MSAQSDPIPSDPLLSVAGSQDGLPPLGAAVATGLTATPPDTSPEVPPEAQAETPPAGPAPGKSHGRLQIKASLQPRDLFEEPRLLDHAFEARVITLLPDAFPGTLGLSLTGRALEQGLWRLQTTDLRRFGEGKHRNVDDTPAGGGAGMVLRPDVVDHALSATMAGVSSDRGRWPVVYLSPRGKPFDQAMAHRFAAGQGITLLCGRFEGVDERVLAQWQIEEVSLGDFVLTGGEIPAQALLDATVRLLPGVLGNAESTVEESFSDGLLEHPQYTRPAVWQDRAIPEVLTGGNHGAIAKWRRAEAERITAERRPDLWQAYQARPKPKKKK